MLLTNATSTQRWPERIEQEEKFRVEEKPKRDEKEDMYVTNGVKKEFW